MSHNSHLQNKAAPPPSSQALFFASLYAVCNVFADILSTKIFIVPFFNWQADGGTIVYPLAFIARDLLHKTAGRRLAAHTVLFTAAFNAVMIGLFWLVFALPADNSWRFWESMPLFDNQTAYAHILLPVSGIVVASIISETASGLLNTAIFSRVIRKNPHKRDIAASLLSNALALTADSFLFSFLAFGLFQSFPLPVIVSIAAANIVFKAVIALAGAPLLRLVKCVENSSLL